MVSYAVHYEMSRSQHHDRILTDFSRMRLEMTKEQPQVLYVAMATWLPKCNMVSYEQQIKYVLMLFFFDLRLNSRNNKTFKTNHICRYPQFNLFKEIRVNFYCLVSILPDLVMLS